MRPTASLLTFSLRLTTVIDGAFVSAAGAEPPEGGPTGGGLGTPLSTVSQSAATVSLLSVVATSDSLPQLTLSAAVSRLKRRSAPAPPARRSASSPPVI